MSEPKYKTRQFMLLPQFKSRTAHQQKYPHSYSINHTYTLFKESGEPDVHALSPTMKTTHVASWGVDINDRAKRPRLVKPDFIDGVLVCGNSGFDVKKANFLASSPECANGPNADPMRAVFYEIKPEEDAKQRREIKRLSSKANNLIYNMDDSELSAYCIVYGIKILDMDGYRMERAMLEDRLVGMLESKQSVDMYKEFIDSLNDDDRQKQIHVAMGIESGHVVFDKNSGAVKFKGGTPVYQVVDKSNFTEEIATWINSKSAGEAFYNILIDRIGVSKSKEVEVDESYDPTVADKGLYELSDSELADYLKESEVLEYKKGVGYHLDGNALTDSEGNYLRSKSSLIELLMKDEEFKTLMLSRASKTL